MSSYEFCDQVGCGRRSSWFVGAEFNREAITFSRGHGSCDEHLAECCRVTLVQLGVEKHEETRLDVRPVFSVEPA